MDILICIVVVVSHKEFSLDKIVPRIFFEPFHLLVNLFKNLGSIIFLDGNHGKSYREYEFRQA